MTAPEQVRKTTEGRRLRLRVRVSRGRREGWRVFRASQKQERKRGKLNQGRESLFASVNVHRDPERRVDAMERAFEGWREERILHREKKRELPEFVFAVFGFPL